MISKELASLSVGHNEYSPQELTERLSALSVETASASKHLAGVPAKIITIPRELRNGIYKHLLKQFARIKLYSVNYEQFEWALTKRIYTSLSLTCRALHEEAVEFLFSEDTFELSLSSNILGVPNYHMLLMKHLELPYWRQTVQGRLRVEHTLCEMNVHRVVEKIEISLSIVSRYIEDTRSMQPAIEPLEESTMIKSSNAGNQDVEALYKRRVWDQQEDACSSSKASKAGLGFALIAQLVNTVSVLCRMQAGTTRT